MAHKRRRNVIRVFEVVVQYRVGMGYIGTFVDVIARFPVSRSLAQSKYNISPRANVIQQTKARPIEPFKYRLPRYFGRGYWGFPGCGKALKSLYGPIQAFCKGDQGTSLVSTSSVAKRVELWACQLGS
ncbi:uncharacterized protein CIMG_12884 [Coccidioides immitis RS]|uniref:Uncharacterized protein n=1 Tax=Coccidioides immitis (strain RS) TaxID=246410 RepID=A0A0D8JSK9_COCIM|nr:uncharacterized protein CIMG_12884 [Coccidioides immitis RS]KJF60335.1 hypothetical protein CIMG_12884 [Coccidioides immitis RS]